MGTPATGSAERFGLLLLAFLFSLSACGQLQLLCHLRLGIVPVLVAAAVTFGVARTISKTPLLDTVGLWAGLAALGLACSRIYDLSWDGQTYHQAAVFQLAHGWNPIWEGPLPIWHQDITWCNQYPKGIWVAEAALYRLSGNIEASKSIGVVLLLAAFLLSMSACLSLPFQRGMSVLLALLAAANPVVICQLTSFYVDGPLGSLLTILVALALLHFRRPSRRYLLAMIAAMALLCATKFTGVVYSGMYAFGVSLFALYRRRVQLTSLVLTHAAGLLIGVALLGFQPYLTNLRAHLHPFHPLAGAHKIDFMPAQLGPKFAAQPRLFTLTESIFSVSTNDREWPRWKIPFSVSVNELEELNIPDMRIGGFGPWFGGAVLLSTIGLIVLLVLHRKTPKLPSSRREKLSTDSFSLPVGLFLLVGILVSCLINPGVWWARYVPQMWLLPIVVAGLLRLHQNRLAWPLTAALLLNVALVTIASVRGTVVNQRYTRAEIDGIRHQKIDIQFNTFDGARLRLLQNGIDFREAPLHCANPQPLARTTALYCPRHQAAGTP